MTCPNAGGSKERSSANVKILSTVLAMRLELATSELHSKPLPKRTQEAAWEFALSRTANLVCSSGIPKRRATARQRAGWSTFLRGQPAHAPVQIYALCRCNQACHKQAVPSVAPPRIVRLLSRYVGMWTLRRRARTPSTGAQNTGFLRALPRDVPNASRRKTVAGPGRSDH